MVQSVLAAAHIEGVAVGEEGLAAQFLHIICNHLGVVGPEKGQVAVFTKVQLNGCILIGKIYLLKAGSLHETVELLQKIFVVCSFKGGEKHI